MHFWGNTLNIFIAKQPTSLNQFKAANSLEHLFSTYVSLLPFVLIPGSIEP